MYFQTLLQQNTRWRSKAFISKHLTIIYTFCISTEKFTASILYINKWRVAVVSINLIQLDMQLVDEFRNTYQFELDAFLVF